MGKTSWGLNYTITLPSADKGTQGFKGHTARHSRVKNVPKLAFRAYVPFSTDGIYWIDLIIDKESHDERR